MKQATRYLWINLVLLLVALTAQAQTTNPISSLTAIPTAAGGDRLIINQAAGAAFTTKQIAVSNLNAGWYSAFVVPQDYGAKGDGSTDDTAALQAWINAAASSQKTALLPPASNNYYKITYPLYVTNQNGLRMLGGGGVFHNPGATLSKCQIRQFTSGSPALVVTNVAGSTQPPDSVHITAVAFVNNTYTADTNSYGVGFVGAAPDSDNCSINYCTVSGFRYGIMNCGAAILTLQGSVACYNGDGYYQGPYQGNQSPVLNANYAQGCSFTHNYSNALYISNGRFAAESCDLIGNATAGIGQELFATNCTIVIRNCNLEHQSATLPAYVVNKANVSFEGGLHQTMAAAGANTYLLVITNMPGPGDPNGTNTGIVLWDAPSYSMATSDGFAFLEVNTNASSYFRSRPSTKYRSIFNNTNYVGGFRMYTNFCESWNVVHFPNMSGESRGNIIGQIQINKTSTPDAPDTTIGFGAQFGGVNTPLDLTQYYQDGQGTMTNNNLIVKGSLVGNGSGLTNVGAGSSIFPNTNEFIIYPRDVWIYGPAYGPATNTMDKMRETSTPGGNGPTDAWRLWQTAAGDGVSYAVPLWCTQIVGTVWFQWYGGTGTSYITNRVRGGHSSPQTFTWSTLTDYGFQLQSVAPGVTNFTFTANYAPWTNTMIYKTLQFHNQYAETNATGNLYWVKARLWLKGNPQILDN